MSEYVEARYVKLALEEARSMKPNVAAKLIYDLWCDLSSFRRLSEAREQTLKSIQLLALSLARAKPCSPINSCPRVGRRKQSH